MFGIEDTRQPDFPTHSECDNCGAMFDNDDLNQLPGDEWLCDDCLKDLESEEQ